MKNKTESTYNFDVAKAEYRAFCEAGKHDIQVFAQPWYLDAVCGNPDDWRVILYKEGDNIVAAFPFSYTQNKTGWWEIKNPWQAKRLGIWMAYGDKNTNYKREVFENKVVKYIIENLPYFDYFQIEFDSRFKNWRVFYDNGFSQVSLYSYVLKIEQSEQDFLSSIKKQNKRDIATLRGITSVELSTSFEEYWTFFEKSYILRNKTISYSKKQIQRLVESVMNHNAGNIFFVRNQEGTIIGGTIVFYDVNRTFCMFISYDPGFKPSPSVLLSYNSIIDSWGSDRDYDFEGSMDSGIAQYYAGFNAELEPYFRITKLSDKAKLKSSFMQTVSLLKKKLFGK